MAPATILNKLAEVRRRERLLRFVWGAARVVAVALVLLLVCCFIDWLIDRWHDTPRSLLALFLLGQITVACGLAILFVVWPTLQRLSDSTIAAWVERAFPAFRHRLVTAVELNRPYAATEGMSPALIAAVTKEAVQKAAATDFCRAVDARRLWWSGYVLAPVLLVVLVLLAIAPLTAAQLLGRQLLIPIDITRSVRFELHDITPLPEDNASDRDQKRPPHTDIQQAAVCASGDRVAIRFKAEGRVSDKTHGTLRIHPEGGSAEDIPLEWESAAPDGEGAIFVAKIPASSVEFTYTAWLGDARLRQEGHVKFEARPTVESQKVVVLLPEYCGLRSDGTRFDQKTDSDPKGEVVGLSGSTAVLTITASKPLQKAVILLISPSQAGTPEKEFPMTLDDSGAKATGRFDLEPGQTAYRIVLWDRFGFVNRVSPRRGIAQLPDEPPIVSLLPEDDETEGAPIIHEKRLLVGYRASSPACLYDARFRYRILHDRGESGKDFQTLPLTEYNGSAEVGDFDLNRGVFAKIRDNDYGARVEFHAMPERKQPGQVPDRREGGGRVIFETGGIPDLKVGDRIEYYIEVRDARPQHLVGSSETRIREIVNKEQFGQWVKQKLREDQKLIELKDRQGSLFDPTRPTPEK